ncbi:MAG TPA: lipopolysaccharide kinase InaA family protein [Planctomycetota bacterium]|nr:lipopolysaccharide kinase InaA family protein [Planctomycetota bacterium]
MVPQGPTPSNVPLPQSTELTCGRASARASVQIAAALRTLLAHDVGEWDRHGFVRTKERTVRSVLAGELGDVPVHIKVFRADTLADRTRDRLRGPQGEREAANLVRAAAMGLPTVEPLACGTAVDGELLRSFLVTRTVASGRPFTFSAATRAQRRAGALLRRMHDHGWLPGDLHPGNLLVDAHDEPWLLDLTSVQHAGEPGVRRRAAALAFFCHDLDAGALDPAAHELLAAYVTAGAGPSMALDPALHRELRLATKRWRARALPAFGRRCTRNCRHTEVPPRRRGLPRWHWHLDGGGDQATLRARCAALADAPGVPDKTGRRGSVWLLPDLVVKERDAGTARRLWQSSYWLLFARVAAAPPIALRLHGGRGLVFAARVAEQSLGAELAAGRLDARAVERAAASLGRNVARLHAHGLGNRDLKLDNLVRDPDSGEVCMVDLDGISRGSATDTRGRGRDLGRLLAAFRAAGEPGGAMTMRTFLRHYLRASRRLLHEPELQRVLLRAQQRAGQWASAHA